MGSIADDTRWLDATDQAALVARSEVSPAELVDAAIARIESLDPSLNAVVIRWFEHARDIARGPLPDGPFRGVGALARRIGAWTHDGARLGDRFLADDGAFTLVVELRIDLVDRSEAFGAAVARGVQAYLG
jgi:amidase